MNVKLVKPTLQWKDQYFNFAKEWELSGEEITPYAARLLGNTYEEWLEITSLYEQEETCRKDFVPASTYFLVNEEKILGAVNIRHRLNDLLLKSGGHIGYGVVPSERKKRYATKMLTLALLLCKDLNIQKALVTCYKTNLGSAKTILNNKGIPENEIIENDRVTQRYWINID